MKEIAHFDSDRPFVSTGGQFIKNTSPLQAKTLLAILFVITLLIAIVIGRGEDCLINRDFFTYWGGRGLLEGLNLFAPVAWRAIHDRYGSSWFPNPVLIYAPPTDVLVAPISSLTIPIASVVRVMLSEWGILLTGCILVHQLESSEWMIFAPFWTVGLAGFLPVSFVLILGQISAVLLVAGVVSTALLDHGNGFRGGSVLGLVAVKPMPLIPFIPAIGLWLVIHKQWRGVAGMIASALAVAIATPGLFPD